MISIVLILLAGSADRPQIVTEMTADKISEAIAWGPTQDSFHAYVSKGNASCQFTTPYLRVAIAAKEAKKAYKPFAEANVTPEMKAPVVQMICHASPVMGNLLTEGVSSVENIVILPRDGGGTPIQPTVSKTISDPLRNKLGNTYEASGMIAIFPLDVLRAENQVHVIFTRKIYPKGRLLGSCQDCAMDFKLDNIR